MRLFALASVRMVLAVGVLATLAGFTARAQSDPPDQAGRVSTLYGTVSVQPSGTEDWGQAYPNLPVGPGDRIYTDRDGSVEVQLGQTYVRIGSNSDITLIGDDENGISWGLAQGSVHLRVFGLWPGQRLNISTPNGDVQVTAPGELRIDVLPDQNATIFTSLDSTPVISGAAGYWQQMGNWQALELAGTNPVYPQWLQPAAADYLDQWSQQRDQQILSVSSYSYVNPAMPGAADLDASGDWTPDSDYGPIWFPRNVPAGWQPYHYGHWISRDPWGWVWVEDEPWGYAPFHYGRWMVYRGRWGWVPGPREQRPVWSPALVVFAGGGSYGGGSVSAWFPLGPGEPYRPWYHCSPQYIDRVNIANIHESRVVHVQNTYVNIVNVRNVTNITYVNRTVGVTAMRQQDFAAGRPVRQAAVPVDARQFERVQVIDQPAPVTRQSFVARPVAHPVPVATRTPTFINQRGMQITAKPGAAPVAPPVRQTQQPRPLPGRTVVAAPPQSRGQNTNQPAANRGNQPAAPASGIRPVGGPVLPHGNPLKQPQAPASNQNTAQPQTGSGAPRPQAAPQPPQGQQNQQPNGRQENQNRPAAPATQPPSAASRPTTPPASQSQTKPATRQPAAPPQAARPQGQQQDRAQPAPQSNKDQKGQKDNRGQKKDDHKDDKKDDK